MSGARPNVAAMQRVPARPSSRSAGQLCLDDLGTPLDQVTFVVVDLETTGTQATDAITEIGAVKVRGGVIIGEFATLVRPSHEISPMITVLTGITNAMVADSPPIEAVLPAFLEFLGSAVVVAHNAPFDVGFLKRACLAHDYSWPQPVVVDTVRLARSALSKSDVPNAKLSTLAHFFQAPTQPTHRALDDARATVHVLHCLFERLGTLHVKTLEDVLTFSTKVPEPIRRKASLADGLPDAPGVYLFQGKDGTVHYIGTSKSIRRRVRSYFTAAETRSRIKYMLTLCTQVVAIECPTALEARIRELRLIAEYQPEFNQRSKRPERVYWLRAGSRGSLIAHRSLTSDASSLGPFTSRRTAHEVSRLLSLTTRSTSEMSLSDVMSNPSIVAGIVFDQLQVLAERQRYEHAAALRDTLESFLRAAAWTSQARSLASCSTMVTLAPTPHATTSWDVVAISNGRFAGSQRIHNRHALVKTVEALLATTPYSHARTDEIPCASAEETTALMYWLQSPGIELVHIDSEWVSPLPHAASVLANNPQLQLRVRNRGSNPTIQDQGSLTTV
ncbi:MAG: DEDD exonuclease domain-containing protein [Actinomycetes bacterium]